MILDIQRAGPSTGMPTKPEQARPAERALRPQRRVAGAGGRGLDAGRLLRRGDRGRADRGQVPHAGLPALRRVPRERLRAVADPRRRTRCPDISASSSRPSRTRATRSCRTSATRRRWRGRGRFPGTPGPRAPHRRAREGRRDRQHLVRPRQPRAMVRAARRRRSRASPPTSPSSRSTTPRARELLVLGWGGTYGPIARGGAPGARGGRQGRAGAPALPQSVPAQPRRGAAALRPRAHPRDEPRPAR